MTQNTENIFLTPFVHSQYFKRLKLDQEATEMMGWVTNNHKLYLRIKWRHLLYSLFSFPFMTIHHKFRQHPTIYMWTSMQFSTFDLWFRGHIFHAIQFIDSSKSTRFHALICLEKECHLTSSGPKFFIRPGLHKGSRWAWILLRSCGKYSDNRRRCPNSYE